MQSSGSSRTIGEKPAAQEPVGDESDDTMTIIAGLVSRGYTGTAARLGLLWFVAITVQGVLIFCVAWHVYHLHELPQDDDDYVKPSCNATISEDDADDNKCLKSWRVKLGFYFSSAAFFWYVLQDQFSTTLPSLLVLMQKEGVSWRWILLCLIDSLITWLNFIIGVFWLSMTQALQDLILNCTALTFIAEIDDCLVKIVKKLGFADKYLQQSASISLSDATGLTTRRKSVAKFGCAMFCAAFSLPLSVGLSMVCYSTIGKQTLNYEDWGIFAGVSVLTVGVLGIFLIDWATKDEMTGNGCLFSNLDDADALSGEEEGEELQENL